MRFLHISGLPIRRKFPKNAVNLSKRIYPRSTLFHTYFVATLDVIKT